MIEDEWNELCGRCDVANMESSVETHADIMAGHVTLEIDKKTFT